MGLNGFEEEYPAADTSCMSVGNTSTRESDKSDSPLNNSSSVGEATLDYDLRDEEPEPSASGQLVDLPDVPDVGILTPNTPGRLFVPPGTVDVCLTTSRDLDTGMQTPGTDISNISVSTKERLAKEANQYMLGQRSSTLAQFRENQQRCMEALRKGQRAAKVAAAIRQVSEPVPTHAKAWSKQASEESVAATEVEGGLRLDDALVAADPLVAVVKNLGSRQYQAYESLQHTIGEVRQEAARQRQELKDLLRKQAREIDELRGNKKKCRGLQVIKTFAVAFGIALGISSATQGVWKGAEMLVRSYIGEQCVGLLTSGRAQGHGFALPPVAARRRLRSVARP